MSSYYNRVLGTLNPSEVARSEDIHLIQSNIQTAFQEMMTDIFGTGCILGEDEENLKLIPTPYTIDQSNTNYNEEKPWISFFDIYLRQKIEIHKSEIQAIRVTIQNTTNLMPTVFAEIRDSDYNLVKETNLKLPITDDNGTEIEFTFNLQHLPLDDYYFVIRPVDINTADLTANGDEDQYDTVTEDNFQILCDRNGNYLQSLDASYNGVDYLEARLLESELKTFTEDGFIETEDENFDLCFEQVFSSGNTYLIENIAPAIVLGEKIYPIDTHVSINGPSPNGDRIDLVTLTTDGQLNVTEGIPFTGEKTEENYPIQNTGLKLAYITTYFADGQLALIEQADDNGVTRRRDILERIRRLEKKIDYQTEYNSPSRIKYVCTLDPILNDASYNMTVVQNEKGEYIAVGDDSTATKNYLWSIANRGYTYETGSSTTVTISCKDVHIPKTKPTKIDKTKDYIKITSKDNSDKVAIVQMNLKIKINNSKNKTVVNTFTKAINSEGNIYLDPWSYKLKKGKYTIHISYGSKSIKVTLQVYDTTKFKATPKIHSMDVNVLDGTLKENTVDIASNTFTGDDSFYKDNITVDTENGEVFLKKINTSEQKESAFPSQSLKDLETSTHTYKINSNTKSLQSEYPMLNITLERDCYLNNITFKVAGTSNLKYMRAVLFHNDRVFNLNTSRKSYRKYLKTKDAADTAFPNEKVSKEITVQSNGKAFTYSMPINKKIKKGTYSLLLYGILKDKKKDGYIKIKEYHTAKATAYGALSRVKGTSSPNQIFMEGENLTNRTMYVKFNKIDDVHNTTGTIISKTINTVDNIKSCKLSHYYDIPNGCYVHTYVSNNGGKTYVEQINNKGTVTFNTAGHELKWRLVFTGSGAKTPKLYFNKTKKYAFKITATLGKQVSKYEDYDRCCATPILNANAITRLLVSNKNVQDPFSEWEYARLWMEDDLDVADIDICFAYAYNDYSTSVGTSIENWGKDQDGFFFSQIFSSLKPSDFSRTSVDYDNYNADVEDDEMNFRFKLQTEYMYNLDVGERIASPGSGLEGDGVGYYTYGDISNESIDMSMFQYGLMDMETIYYDTDESNNDLNRVPVYAPYYQAMYKPTQTTTTTITNEEDGDAEENTTTNEVTNLIWAKDSDPNFNNACIIGVSFVNGFDVEEKYTNMSVDIFPNLRDCIEDDEATGQLKTSFTDEDDDSKTITEIRRNGLKDTDKYYNDNGEAYIPGGTLELVIAFNPWGLVETDNPAYGKVIPIKKDLISCVHQIIDVNMSDFYGRTIYAIGIRVSEKAQWDGDQHPSLHANDIIGLGAIICGGYNIKPYTPYVQNDTSAKRLQWQTDVDWKNGNKSAVYVENKIEKKNATYDGAYAQSYIAGYKNDDPNTTTNTKTNTKIYSKTGTWLTPYNVSNSEFSKIQQNNITTKINDITYTNVKSQSNDIVFDLYGTGFLFKLTTMDINLVPYDYINVQYYIEQTKVENQEATAENGQIYKGDITLLLYDTINVEGATPIEKLVLPAWGRTQEKIPYNRQKNKIVNAWFKVHSDASQVKAIRIYRDNPTGSNTGRIKLHLNNILFYNAAEIPALGPQMHIRIYPKNIDGHNNTKIRKYGGIYRLR